MMAGIGDIMSRMAAARRPEQARQNTPSSVSNAVAANGGGGSKTPKLMAQRANQRAQNMAQMRGIGDPKGRGTSVYAPLGTGQGNQTNDLMARIQALRAASPARQAGIAGSNEGKGSALKGIFARMAEEEEEEKAASGKQKIPGVGSPFDLLLGVAGTQGKGAGNPFSQYMNGGNGRRFNLFG